MQITRHRSHVRQVAALPLLACLALNANAADFVLKETSADKLVCHKVAGKGDCHVENSGRYTLDIKVSKQDFDANTVRFQKLNECSPISIDLGGLQFASRFCNADKPPAYPWQDLNVKWSEAKSLCKVFGSDGECLREQAIAYRSIAAKILKTGGMLLKINGIYRATGDDAQNFGQPILKADCVGVESHDPLPTQLTLTIGDYALPSIAGQITCNTTKKTTTKYDGQFELTKMTINAKKVEQ